MTKSPGISEKEAADSWLSAGRFAAILAVLIFISFPAVILGKATFVIRDFGMFGYPLAFFHRQAFWSGHLPLWNPLSACGLPFLAQWNTLTLYPFSLIYLLLPLTWSLPIFCLAHLFWGGLGMYVWVFRWTNHRLAAALAGVIFAFNGLMLNSLMWPNIVATLGWLPWVIWLGQRAWREGGKALVWAVLAGAMQMLSGGPEPILLTWVLLGVFAGLDLLSKGAQIGRLIVHFGAMGLLVGLVCAAQLLPFMELLAHSQRDRGFGSTSHNWSMPYWGWANFLVPLFRTTPTAQGVYYQNGQYWTSSYYAGLGTLLLAAAAVWRARERRVFILGGLMVGGLVLALGDSTLVYQGLLAVVPGFGFIRYPIKYVVLVLAVVPVLAGFGIRALDAGKEVANRFELGCAITLLILIGVIEFWDWNTAVHDAVWQATRQNALSRAAEFALIVAAGFLVLRAVGFRRRVLSALLLLLFWADFTTQVPNQNPGAPPQIYAANWGRKQLSLQPEPEIGRSRVMLAPQTLETLRFYPLAGVGETFLRNRLAIRANCNLLDGLPQIDGFFSMTPREAAIATQLPYQHPEREYPALLDLLAVSHASISNTLEWAARPSAMPMVTAGQEPVFVDEHNALEALSKMNMNFREQILLPTEARGKVTATRQTEAVVSVSSFRNELIEIHTSAEKPCLVLVSQAWYPAWKAYVDGTPTKIWKADFAFQAVQVPEGKHKLAFVYEDKMFHVGSALSGVGLAGCLAMYLLSHKRGKVKAGEDGSSNGAGAAQEQK